MTDSDRAIDFILVTFAIALWMLAGHAFIYGLPHWMYVEWNRPHETTTMIETTETIETTNTTTTDSRAWCVAIGGDCVVSRD